MVKAAGELFSFDCAGALHRKRNGLTGIAVWLIARKFCFPFGDVPESKLTPMETIIGARFLLKFGMLHHFLCCFSACKWKAGYTIVTKKKSREIALRHAQQCAARRYPSLAWRCSSTVLLACCPLVLAPNNGTRSSSNKEKVTTPRATMRSPALSQPLRRHASSDCAITGIRPSARSFTMLTIRIHLSLTSTLSSGGNLT